MFSFCVLSLHTGLLETGDALLCPENLDADEVEELENQALLPDLQMASKAGVEIGFAAWGKEGFPTIAKEMKALCDYSFQDPKELEHFLFD